jgi:hypothetical protein
MMQVDRRKNKNDSVTFYTLNIICLKNVMNQLSHICYKRSDVDKQIRS